MSACAKCLDTGYIEVDGCTCDYGYGPDSYHDSMCGTAPCPEGCWDAASAQNQHRGEVSA